jgi:predicted metal-binding membrane protein
MRLRVDIRLLVRDRVADPSAVAVAGVLGAALVTWVVTIERMRGMDAGPGTDLGGLGWFLGVWVTMMAAMMLPSTLPMVSAVQRVSRERPGADPAALCTPLFVAGYIATWTVYGLAVYGVFRALRSADPGFLAWDRQGPLVAGAAVAVAGLYQATPLKRACLRRCRTPLHFVMHRWRTGPGGGFAMGVEHGGWCLGCCFGLMLVLVVLGAMSLTWMTIVAALVLAEKVLPLGERLAAMLTVVLIGLGIWIAAAPGSVPGLTQPGMAMSMPTKAPASGAMDMGPMSP